MLRVRIQFEFIRKKAMPMHYFRSQIRFRLRVKDWQPSLSIQVKVTVKVRCFVVSRGHKGVLCVWQRCGRRRWRSGFWPAARREGVQHANRVRVRVRVRVR